MQSTLRTPQLRRGIAVRANCARRTGSMCPDGAAEASKATGSFHTGDGLVPRGAKVAIVGGGSVGIFAARQCIDEGLRPTVFEAAAGVGGVWRSEERRAGDDGCWTYGNAWRSLHTNSSWQVMSASDFPFPFETRGVFPFHDEIVRYLNLYLDKFGLRHHVLFNTKVHRVERASVGDGCGRHRWTVLSSPTKNHEDIRSDGFDAVFVCTGQFHTPRWPKGLEPGGSLRAAFGGRVRHSREYRGPEKYQGKRVLVVGVGNSALDISLELARTGASSVSVSYRSGSTILPTRMEGGEPADHLFLARGFNALPKLAKAILMSHHMQATNDAFRAAGMPPPTGGLGSIKSHVANCKYAREYADALREGSLTLVPQVKRTFAGGVELVDGSTLVVDELLVCSGYTPQWPVLTDELLAGGVVRTNPAEPPFWSGYRRVMHPREHTLFLLGGVTTLGNEACVGEMQARWAAAVLSGAVKLPWQREIDAHCRAQEQQVVRRNARYPQFVQYLKYMDTLAEDIGCRPPRYLALLSTPRLAAKVAFGPAVPAQFRLRGPHRWDGAAGFIEAHVPLARL